MPDYLPPLKDKSVLPFYEVAHSGESISSWIIRNAISNYMSPHDFLKTINAYKGNHYDYDMGLSYGDICSILKHTIAQQSPVVLMKTKNEICKTLEKHRIKPFPSSTLKQSKRYPSQFCRSCLSKEKPFIKLKWRNPLIFGCSICKHFFSNECSKCGRPVHFFKNQPTDNYNQRSVFSCFSCKTEMYIGEQIEMNNVELLILNQVEEIFTNPCSDQTTQFLNIIEAILTSSKIGLALRSMYHIPLSCNVDIRALSATKRIKIFQAALDFRVGVFQKMTTLNKSNFLRAKDWERYDIKTT